MKHLILPTLWLLVAVIMALTIRYINSDERVDWFPNHSEILR